MTTYTDLPIGRISADDFEAMTVPADPKVGDVVYTHSRGSYRKVRVAKVGPKRLTVEYTTDGAIKTAESIAEQSRLAAAKRDFAHAVKTAARYRKMANVMEAHGMEPTNERDGWDAFVKLDTLPAEFAALDSESGTNAARSTVVYPAAQYREWADNQDARATKYEASFADAAEYDALPFATKVAQHVHMTTKNVKREDVRA